MNALSLLLSLALQGGPVHADLHPAQADIYVELGDVSEMLTAMDRAPLVRFLGDARLEPLMKELSQKAGMGELPARSCKSLALLALNGAFPGSHVEGWLDGLGTLSASFELRPGGQDSLEWLLVIDFDTAEQAGMVRDLLRSRAFEHEPAGDLAGAEILRAGDEKLVCLTSGTRLALAADLAGAQAFAARARHEQPGLLTQEGFARQVKALPASQGTPLLWAAMTHPLAEILSRVGQAEKLAQLPSEMNPFQGVTTLRMQLVGDRYVTEIHSSGSRASTSPVQDSWLEPVSENAMFVFASAFDGAAASAKVRTWLQKDEQTASMAAAVERNLGYGPEHILSRLGPAMTVYTGTLAGPSLPEIHAWVDCADPAAFQEELTSLVGAFSDLLPGFDVKTRPYKVKKAGSDEKIEVPITTLTLPPQANVMPMISLSPSFAPVGGKIVFALNSMDVKSELKRVYSGEGDAIVAGSKPLAKRGFELPKDTHAVIVMDWGKMLGGVVSTVKAFAGMAQPGDLPFDFAKLPPPEMFLEYFKPTFHFVRSIEGGTYRRNEASFGPETWLGIAGAALYLRGGMRGAMPMEPTVLEPVEGQ